jgi:hypothetical protein
MTLHSYPLVGLDAVAVDLVVDGHRAKVVEPETGHILHSVRRGATGSVSAVIGHVVNARTSPLRKLAPAYLMTTP